jgi:hypothetical protein
MLRALRQFSRMSGAPVRSTGAEAGDRPCSRAGMIYRLLLAQLIDMDGDLEDIVPPARE